MKFVEYGDRPFPVCGRGRGAVGPIVGIAPVGGGLHQPGRWDKNGRGCNRKRIREVISGGAPGVADVFIPSTRQGHVADHHRWCATVADGFPSTHDYARIKGVYTNILKPVYFIIIVGRAKHIRVAVSIQVGCIDRDGTIGIAFDDALRSEGTVSQIFVPGDFIIVLRGGKDIRIAVVIHIHGIDRKRPVSSKGDNLLSGKRTAPQVFVPGNFIILKGGRDHIHVPVEVDIRCIDRASQIG